MKQRAKTAAESNASRWLLVGLVLFTGLAMTIYTARASDDLDQGLKVGQTIPLALSAPDQNGKTLSLKALTGRSGLILLFTRSLDW